MLLENPLLVLGEASSSLPTECFADVSVTDARIKARFSDPPPGSNAAYFKMKSTDDPAVKCQAEVEVRTYTITGLDEYTNNNMVNKMCDTTNKCTHEYGLYFTTGWKRNIRVDV